MRKKKNNNCYRNNQKNYLVNKLSIIYYIFKLIKFKDLYIFYYLCRIM